MTLINQALANKVQRIGMQLISVLLSSELAPFYRNQNWTNQKKNRKKKIHKNKIKSNRIEFTKRCKCIATSCVYERFLCNCVHTTATLK